MKQKNLPKVSIIIPVYNGENTLKKCLNSIIDQNYPPIEIIIIDNNSTDKTKKIIKEYEKKNTCLRYVFEEIKSRGAARNTGINASSGEIIAMIDADCVAPNNWLTELIKPIVYENETVVRGSIKSITSNYWSKNIQIAEEEFLKRTLNNTYINHLGCGNCAFVASVIKRLQFDPHLRANEDIDLSLRLREKEKIRYIPLTVGHHHKNSFWGTWSMYVERGFWAVKVYKKHRKNLHPRDGIITESIGFRQIITFPIWIIIQFLLKPFGEAFFILVKEIAWRVGLIWGWCTGTKR